MANKTQVNVLARILAEATQNKIQASNVKESLWQYLPNFINSLQRNNITVDNFDLTNNTNAASFLFHYGRSHFGLNNGFTKADTNHYVTYLANLLKNKRYFNQVYNSYSRQVHKEYKSYDMGDELSQTLAPYIDSNSLQKVKRAYHHRGIQFPPGRGYENRPDLKKQYDDFAKRVGRTKQILDYLSKQRINFSITNSTNPKHPDELVAVLPEHANAHVTLMSDNYNHIGNINTWENQYSFDSTSNPAKYNASILLDTVFNPNSRIVNVFRIPKKHPTNPKDKYSKNSIVTRAIKDSNGKWRAFNVFTTHQDKHLQKMKVFVDKVKSNESALTKDEIAELNKAFGLDDDHPSDNNGQDINDIVDDDRFKINPEDKQEEIKNRFNDDWTPINAKRSDDEPLEYVKKRIHDDRMHHGLYRTIYNQARALGMQNVIVSRNKKGVYKYDYYTYEINPRTNKYVIDPKTGKPAKNWTHGIIGGYIRPNKNGAFKLEYNGKFKGWSVPGMRAYIDNNGDLRVKPFSSILREKVKQTMLDEMLNSKMKDSVKAYSALDKLYTTDSYSTVLRHLGVNSPSYEKALIDTLHKRIRLPDTDLNNANALNEDPQKQKERQQRYGGLNTKRTELLAKSDLRTIPKQWQKVVDREMTGIGSTMGATLYIGDDVKINPKTGTLTSKPGVEHTKTALHKRPECQWDKYDPADRNIMWFSQATRNVPMNVVNVAYMTLSGYTENDAAVVTKKYAEKENAYTDNPDKKHKYIIKPDGTSRGLKIGDKITDAHGNKSTISYIIDPDKTDDLHTLVSNDQKKLENFNKTFAGYQLSEDQEKQKRDLLRKLKIDGLHYKMAAIVKANPDLDVIANPYSSISRLNAGSVREMQSRGGITHLKDATYFDKQGNAYSIPLHNITMGKETYAVCEGQRVDEKTAVYTEDMYKKGKGRKFDQQLAAAAASADLPKTLNAIYKNNPNHGWNKFFDDLHLMGYDIDKHHYIGQFNYSRPDAAIIKMPERSTINEILSESDEEVRRKTPAEYGYDDFNDKYNDAVNKAKQNHVPIIMELPPQCKYKTISGQYTNKIVVPYDKIKAQDDLHEIEGKAFGTQNSWRNAVHNIYKYATGISQTKSHPHQQDFDMVKRLTKQLGQKVVAEDFAHKNNIIKSQIYSRPMPGSSTSVVTPDPTLKLDEIEVGEDTWNNMIKADPKLKIDPKHEVVMGWRNPVLRDGGMRAFHVKMNPDYTGVGINPVNDKSMDMDHDGDTMGLAPIADRDAQKELKKMLPSHQLIDESTQDKSSFLEKDLELTGSYSRQGRMDAKAKALKLQHQQGWTNNQISQATEAFYWQDKNNPKHILDRLDSPDMNNEYAGEEAQQIIDDGFFDNKNASLGIGLDCSNAQTYFTGVQNLVASGAKGHYNDDFKNEDEYEKAKKEAHVNDSRPLYYRKGSKKGIMHSKSVNQLIHYYYGHKTDEDMHNSMIALAVKADVVGPAGASQQKLLWSERNRNPKAVLDITYRTTDGALQAKHDAHDAKVREQQIVGPLPTVLKGEDPNQGFNAYKSTLRPIAFVNDLNDIYNNKLKTNQSIDEIRDLARGLTTTDPQTGTRRIMKHDEREQISDPIDELAYGTGSPISMINNAMGLKKVHGQWQSIKPRQIATGKYTKLFNMPDELCTSQLLAPKYELSQEQQKQQQQQAQQERFQALQNQQSSQSKPNQQMLNSPDDLAM